MSEDSSQPSTSANTEKFNFIHRNGGIVLLRDGHQYTKKKDYKSGWSLWRCINWRKKCLGSITIKENDISKQITHQCERNEVNNSMAQKLHECRQKVLTSDFSPIPNIYNNFKAEFNDAGLDLLEKLPSFANIKSGLYNARNKEAGVPKIQCKQASEVMIPSQFMDFVLVDYYNESSNIRIIIFGNKKVLEEVHHIKFFLSDGTFASCPAPFAQLYTIHGDFESDGEHTQIMPLIYALLNRKNEETYKTLFQLLKDSLPRWEPQKYMTDFEQAAMNAISTVFPTIEVKGCYFHFSQNVWKKAKGLNLTKDKRFRKHVTLCDLLPLLPREHIADGWCYVMEDSPDSHEIREFNDYMVTQWLEDEDFVDTWCANNQRHRTTNAVESWHKKLNSTVSKNPNLYQLLKILKEDANLQIVRIKQSNAETPIAKRRPRKEIDNDVWYHHVTDQLLAGKITVGHCLEKFAT